MNWEQKLEALNALTPHSLIMRQPGDWYVSASIEIVDSDILIGSYGNGKNPEEAVNEHWAKYTKLKTEQYIAARKGSDTMYVKWNGFMWMDFSYKRNK
jgi:hypothetical protein